MAGRTVPLFCYWDGEVKIGAEGIDYDGPPPRVLRASNEITMNELVEMIYGITGWDRLLFELEIIGRYLAGTTPTRYFIALPVVDDASLTSMFDMTISPQLGWNCIQLYLKKKPVSTHVHLQSGSCTPLLAQEVEASVFHSSAIFGERRSPLVSADSIGVAGRPMNHNISEMNAAKDLTWVVDGTDIRNELRGDREDEAANKNEAKSADALSENVTIISSQKQLASPQSEEQLYVGRKFATKEELIRAVKLYSIKAHQQYKVRDSSPDLYVLKCKQAPQCPWYLRALVRNEKSFFEITKLRGPHTCVEPIINKDHVQLDSAFIANEVKDFVKAGLSVAAIQKVIASRFSHNISYRKAWSARHKAMGQLFSDNEGSSQPSPAKRKRGRPKKQQQPGGDDAGSSQPSQAKPKTATKKKKQQPDNDVELSPSQDEAPPTSKRTRKKCTS